MTMTPEQFVEAIGTGNIIHNSGDLFGDHLRAVQRVLKEWGENEELQLAGLFHSIYGEVDPCIEGTRFVLSWILKVNMSTDWCTRCGMSRH